MRYEVTVSEDVVSKDPCVEAVQGQDAMLNTVHIHRVNKQTRPWVGGLKLVKDAASMPMNDEQHCCRDETNLVSSKIIMNWTVGARRMESKEQS